MVVATSFIFTILLFAFTILLTYYVSVLCEIGIAMSLLSVVSGILTFLFIWTLIFSGMAGA